MASDVVIPSGPIDKDDILDALSADDLLDDNKENDKELEDNKDEDKEIKDKEPDEDVEEDKELTEEEIELEDDDEDKELSFQGVPKRQEILKQFPELFKKFPTIEKAIYREQRYSEIFPTLADANRAVDDSSTLRKFESELLDGNLTNVLKVVKDQNQDSFSKLSSNLLDSLRQVDERAYMATCAGIVRNSLIHAYNRGKNNKDDQLEIAAQLIHKFVFGDHNIPEGQQNQNQNQNRPNPREEDLSRREQDFARSQLTTAVHDVTTRTDNSIKSAIEKNIDPKNVMSSYIKSKAIEDCIRQVSNEISSDSRFKGILDKLWQSAHSDSYSENAKSKIRNALLTKAKTILPGIITKVKSEALKGNSTRKESKNEKPIERGRTAPSNSNNSSKKEPKRGMSTLDFLNQD